MRKKNLLKIIDYFDKFGKIQTTYFFNIL